jgi:hypothetical protein
LRAEEAKARLTAMKRAIPQPDPVAQARMKFELENHEKPGMMHHVWGIFKQRPDTTMAAKSGSPTMTPMRPGVPVSVPQASPAGVTDVTGEVAGNATGSTDVSVSTVTDSTALDNNPDARRNAPAQAAPAPAENGSTAQPLPTNHPLPAPKADTKEKKKEEKTEKTAKNEVK